MATEKQARAVLELISNLIQHPAIVGFGIVEGLSKKAGPRAAIYLSRRVKKGSFPHEVNGVTVTTMVVGKPRLENNTICFRGKAEIH